MALAVLTVALVGLLGMVAASARTPEYRTGWATTMRDWKSQPGDIVESAVFVLYLIVMVLAPIVIALGVAALIAAKLYQPKGSALQGPPVPPWG